MENISEKFIDRLIRLHGSQLPDSVFEKVRECFMDYISVTLGGGIAYRDRNEKYILENKLIGDAHIIGYKKTSDINAAVMINAFNAHYMELDDSHRVAMTHLGAPIFSALLSAAEIHETSLNDLLRAAVIGYEAAIRLANAIQPSHKKKGFHVSGTCCTIGCAMGIAVLLGYTKQQMSNVLCAACTSAAGLLGAQSDNSEQKPYNIANAAVAGTNAALYGKYFRGAEDILNDSRGFLRTMSDSFDTDKLFENGYAIETIYQKLYAACRHCHAPMEAMLNIRNGNSICIDDIDDIEVLVYDLAIKGHDHTEISSISSAKQSIPYGVAVAAKFGDCGMNAFTNDKLSDDDLMRAVKRVRVVENEELTSLVPGMRAAIVNVKLRDGRFFTERINYAKGEPENPITKEEFEEKFYSLLEYAKIDKEIGQRIRYFVCFEGEKTAKTLFRWI